MRPDVHHCCLHDRQVKHMMCSVHPHPPFAVCYLLSHPLSMTPPAVRALGRNYRQLTGQRASVGWAQAVGSRPTAHVCWLLGLLPPRDSHWACAGRSGVCSGCNWLWVTGHWATTLNRRALGCCAQLQRLA